MGSGSGDARRMSITEGADLSDALVIPWGTVVDMAFSSDGRRVITARTSGLAEIWDFSGDKLILRAALEGHADQVHALAYSPNGRLAATGGYDGLVKVWDVEASVMEGIGVETIGLDVGSESHQRSGLQRRWDAFGGRQPGRLCPHVRPVTR